MTAGRLRGALIDQGPCPYLPGRRFTALLVEPGWAPHYAELMDLGFRRSGDVAYAPACAGCRACVPMRVDAQAFRPTRDQRRCERRNRDLRIAWQPRGWCPERAGLWTRYQAAVHGAEDAVLEPDDGAGVEGGELHARDAGGRLLAVSRIDRVPYGLSSVTCWWEPDEARRGLGTCMALHELALVRELGLRWWYLGYWVAGSATMDYKRRYGPHELYRGGRWCRADADPRADALPSQGAGA